MKRTVLKKTLLFSFFTVGLYPCSMDLLRRFERRFKNVKNESVVILVEWRRRCQTTSMLTIKNVDRRITLRRFFSNNRIPKNVDKIKQYCRKYYSLKSTGFFTSVIQSIFLFHDNKLIMPRKHFLKKLRFVWTREVVDMGSISSTFYEQILRWKLLASIISIDLRSQP